MTSRGLHSFLIKSCLETVAGTCLFPDKCRQVAFQKKHKWVSITRTFIPKALLCSKGVFFIDIYLLICFKTVPSILHQAFGNSTAPTSYTVQCECAIKVNSHSLQGARGLVSASQPDVSARNDCSLCWCCGFNALSGRTNKMWMPHRSLKQPAKGYFHVAVWQISALSFDCAHEIWARKSVFGLW